ncbi:MAG: hypothetical protein LBP92_12510 [Deltaproteobacteria bacterium]|nr:hypothetical protein [Deltaproteobacteria bacterium]
MKLIKKGPEPESLREYKTHSPNQTWEGLRGDGLHDGRAVVEDCYGQVLADQGYLCAYCECTIDRKPDRESSCRIEHFIPKSCASLSTNWNLDWQNILATCQGGEHLKSKHHLPANLSCDAHKNHVMNKSNSMMGCEGWILNPLRLPLHVNLFSLDKRQGYLEPNDEACSSVKEIAENKHKTTKDLVLKTIQVLNLNCDRLAELRRKIIVNIDKNIKTMRVSHVRREDAPKILIDRYFAKKWPEFFTTIRCYIPDIVEPYLKSINYSG